MGDETITVETTVELEPEEVSEIIGTQLILDGKGEPYAYLAGLAFDGMEDDECTIVEILEEYLTNERAFKFTSAEYDHLESTLRSGYRRGE